MDDLLSEFLTETNENLESLDLELVKLEQNPNDPELLGNIFRLVHTIKGTSGFLGLSRLESVAHSGENVLGNFRDGSQEVTPDAVSLILESLDRIKYILGVVEDTEAEPDGNDDDLIARLDIMYRAGRDGSPAEFAPEARLESLPAADSVPASTLYERLGGASTVDTAVELMYRRIEKDDEIRPFFDNVDMALLQGRQVEFMIRALGGPDEYRGRDMRAAHQTAVEEGLNAQHFDTVAGYLRAALIELEVAEGLVDEVLALVATTRNDILGLEDGVSAAVDSEPAVENMLEPEPVPEPEVVAEASPEPEPVAEAAPQSEAQEAADSASAEPAQSKESAIANQSIRVTVDLLENLMTMVSELVLTRNQLMQMVRKHEDSEFKVPLQRLSHVTTDLQEGVMKTRMQPIGNAWGKLPRIIRDLAIELDKKIDLQMLGADTELDRQVLEIIKDPLTHMVRNSADHGLETGAERVAAGKAEVGKVVLNAYHEGGHIIIEISDDGRGINVDKIKKKAIESGIATEAQVASLTDQQILQYIFRAGFSTAEKVTNVSGRGVGMDVVRTNIEKIGGQVELKSQEGRGSTFTIKIPLTLAIVSALIVDCSGERYAIPQLSVVELVRISANSEHRIERIKDTPVLRLRNRLLPLVSLAGLLNLESAPGFPGSDNSTQPAEAGDDEAEKAGSVDDGTFIIVAQVGSYTFGLCVDGVYDTEEIVVKPVAPILRDIPIYSGNTILGDGSVIMILDPNGIAAATGEITVADHASDVAAAADAAARERTPLLIFRAGGLEPKAVPLALVARLEELDRKSIENSNGVPVVQYRGQLMPLMSIDKQIDFSEEGRQPVVVFTDRERSMGLLVDEIVDIVEENLKVELESDREGVLGSAVIAGKATDVIDTSAYLSRAFSDWFGTKASAMGDGENDFRRVLLVDDSPFFRNLLSPLLKVAGYDVTAVESGNEALLLRESGANFDIIVSDIEMPGMSGFELAEQIRQGGAWQETPLVALSSRTSSDDLDRGRDVGFDDYVGKLDRDALLASLGQTLSGLKGAA